jgi:hypothetical protein
MPALSVRFGTDSAMTPIHGKNPPARETSGIKRIAIMHDDGVNAFGFTGHPDILLEWMIENGFPLRNVNLALYD